MSDDTTIINVEIFGCSIRELRKRRINLTAVFKGIGFPAVCITERRISIPTVAPQQPLLSTSLDTVGVHRYSTPKPDQARPKQKFTWGLLPGISEINPQNEEVLVVDEGENEGEHEREQEEEEIEQEGEDAGEREHGLTEEQRAELIRELSRPSTESPRDSVDDHLENSDVGEGGDDETEQLDYIDDVEMIQNLSGVVEGEGEEMIEDANEEEMEIEDEEEEDEEEEEEEETIEHAQSSKQNSSYIRRNLLCKWPNCRQTIRWRPKYGRTRLFDHALTHCKVGLKCLACDDVSGTSRQLRYHYGKHKGRKFPKINVLKMIEPVEPFKKVVNDCFGDQLDLFSRRLTTSNSP